MSGGHLPLIGIAGCGGFGVVGVASGLSKDVTTFAVIRKKPQQAN